jgi:hypothetical protein
MQKLCATVAVVLALFALTLSAQIGPAPGQMTAWVVNVSGGSNDMMEMRVNDWSSASERQRLINAFADGGQSGLLRELERVPIKGGFGYRRVGLLVGTCGMRGKSRPLTVDGES